MKKLIDKILAILMSFVVLFSTMSFTVDMHYCGDYLVDTAVFSKADTCGMEMRTSINPDCSTVVSNCCSEQQINFDGQKELQNTVDKITIEQQKIVTSFIYSYITFCKGAKNIIPFKDYSPPPILKDRYKYFEVYLI